MSEGIRRVQQLDVRATPLVGRFGLFRERLEVRTNDPRVLAVAERAFGRFDVPASGPWLRLRLAVAEPKAAPGSSRVLDARDLIHDTAGSLFAIGLGEGNRAAVDLEGGFGTATVTAELAADGQLLRYAFLEAMAQSMLTGGRGYVPVHASCVVRDGVGVVLQAPAGTGKSTLALACARRGWGLLAEDVVFARPVDGPGGEGDLEVWGMPWTQRLLPDAPRFFPELASVRSRLQANGEHKLEVDLDVHVPGTATPRALAGPAVLLGRDTGGATRAEWLAPGDELQRILEVLWPWEAGWTDGHQRTAERLLAKGVLRLHLNSTPDEAVDALEDALARGVEFATSPRPGGATVGAPTEAGGHSEP